MRNNRLSIKLNQSHIVSWLLYTFICYLDYINLKTFNLLKARAECNKTGLSREFFVRKDSENFSRQFPLNFCYVMRTHEIGENLQGTTKSRK